MGTQIIATFKGDRAVNNLRVLLQYTQEESYLLSYPSFPPSCLRFSSFLFRFSRDPSPLLSPFYRQTFSLITHTYTQYFFEQFHSLQLPYNRSFFALIELFSLQSIHLHLPNQHDNSFISSMSQRMYDPMKQHQSIDGSVMM